MRTVIHLPCVGSVILALAALAPGLLLCTNHALAGGKATAPLTITSRVPCRSVPLSVVVDFARLIQQADLTGVLDPNSVRIVDVKTGESVPHALTDDFAYADKGRVEWVMSDPAHTAYEVRFATIDKRVPITPARFTPRIGVGDLLRFNTGAPAPFAMPAIAGLTDLTGDGKRDLVGCWSYPYRPGDPWDGVICYPRVGDAADFEFGDLRRVRYVSAEDPDRYRHFLSSSHYLNVAFADVNGDDLVDVVFRPQFQSAYRVYLNSGDRGPAGLPTFVAAGTVPLAEGASNRYGEFRVLDLDGDGARDIVVRGTFCRNTNPKGWPMQLAPAVALGLCKMSCFYDMDGDGALDGVGFNQGDLKEGRPYRLAWQKNLRTHPPTFGPPQLVESISARFIRTQIAAVTDGPRKGLLVEEGTSGFVTFYEQDGAEEGVAQFKRVGDAVSCSAVMCLGDQSTPHVCDWDDDGDLDILIGGGHGWPRIVINHGTTEKPAYAVPERILADGKPIRLVRNEILGPPNNGHNMGYPFPAYVDWDGDGLPDLMLPNETNRILWYRNTGTRRKPAFSERRQLTVDGFPDSDALRTQSAQRACDPESNNGCYPYEAERPFMWRTGAAFADWNGDGLMDLVTDNCAKREPTLFVQYRAAGGTLRLKQDGPVKLTNGALLHSVTVPRTKWTESYRPVDWDGDGLMDLFYSVAGHHHLPEASSSMSVFLNRGTRTAAAFAEAVPVLVYGRPIRITNHGPHADVRDMDGDGKPDVLCHVEWATYPFYRHAALTMKTPPRYTLGEAVLRQN